MLNVVGGNTHNAFQVKDTYIYNRDGDAGWFQQDDMLQGVEGHACILYNDGTEDWVLAVGRVYKT